MNQKKIIITAEVLARGQRKHGKSHVFFKHRRLTPSWEYLNFVRGRAIRMADFFRKKTACILKRASYRARQVAIAREAEEGSEHLRARKSAEGSARCLRRPYQHRKENEQENEDSQCWLVLHPNGCGTYCQKRSGNGQNCSHW